MKISVYQQEQEDILTLKLVPAGNEPGYGVDLIAVDGNGIPITNGKLLHISGNGYFESIQDVNATLGLKLDTFGQVVIHKSN